jgi:CDP-diglyceride synthetase
MLLKFSLMCLATFILGYLLTYILYRVRNKPFRGSLIQTKIHTWILIFAVVLVVSRNISWLSSAVFVLILAGIVYDLYHRSASIKAVPLAYVLAFVILAGMAVLIRISAIDTVVFLGVWYLALLSDVTAYFAGNFIGKHHLPDSLNPNKSWEGVAGQLAGALIGYIAFVQITSISGWLVLAVGFGAATGDLCNSYVKRRGGFKDWSQTIPGHGGFIDRLCSLGYASVLALLIR